MTFALGPHFTILRGMDPHFWTVGTDLNARFCGPKARALPLAGPRASSSPSCDPGTGSGCSSDGPLVTTGVTEPIALNEGDFQ